MQRLSGTICLALCAIASFADAAHYHHSHRRPSSGLSSGSPHSSGGPFGSGSGSGSGSGAPPFLSGAPSSVPYPAGNGTIGGATGTGTVGTISTTISTTIQSTIYVTAPEGGESPTSAGGAAGSGGAGALATAVTGSGSSDVPGGPAEGGSSCAALVTVTITEDSTVTVTMTPSPSEAPIESKAPVASQSAASSQAPMESQAPIQSQPPVVPQSSSPVVAASSSVPAGLMSSAIASPYQAPSSSTPVAESTTGLPGYSAPTQASSSALATSATVPASGIGSVAPVSSSVAASTPSSTSSSSPTNTNSLTPNGIKAGVAGYQSITDKSSWSQFTPHIGWYSDYWPNTPDSGSVSGIGMLWGNGHQGGGDAERLTAFKALTTTPKYIMGFYEPDWTPPDSSNISSSSAASTWSTTLAPLGAKGTLLGSPSMATQKDESWLTPFGTAPQHPTWDYTCIHTNKPNVTGVKEDVEYYLGKYKKPIWVSEFACVDDVTWTPCTDADEIKSFIQDVVAFLQANESVVAYGYSNGDGLGTVWPMIDSSSGAITASGQVYLDTISAL